MFAYISFSVLTQIVTLAEIQCFDATIPCLDQENMGRNYEINTDVSIFSVRGRLHKSLTHWKQINAPQFVLETIEFGYKLPLLTTPPARIFRNNKSALDERVFVEDAIRSLLDVNCIEELVESPGIY